MAQLLALSQLKNKQRKSKFKISTIISDSENKIRLQQNRTSSTGSTDPS
jgi:hypothetical protein